jgi:hypothetical protein
MQLGAFLDIPNPMPKQRPQRCDARRRRSDAARYRADPEGRLMEYLRSSSWCRNWPVRGKKRCRLHGGFSTGPRTPERKARTAAATSDVPSASQLRIGEDHLAQGGVIADIAGAAADVAVHRLNYACLHLCPRRRRSGEGLNEHLRLVDEPRRAVAHWKAK